jgi:hypothetical protein
MRSFVIAISEHGKSIAGDFVVLPQNGQDLITTSGSVDGSLSGDYLAAIDGQGGSPNISCIACCTCFSEGPLLTRLLYVNAVFFFRKKVI